MSKDTDEHSSVIAEVEDFIRRLHDGDYIISKEAHKIEFSKPRDGAVGLVSRKEIGNLADRLAHAMSIYEVNKGKSSLRRTSAISCLMWINRAFSWGVIKEGKGLLTRLKKCQERNLQLETDIQQITSDYISLQGRYMELNELFQRFSPSKKVNK